MGKRASRTGCVQSASRQLLGKDLAQGNRTKLDQDAIDTIDAVIKFYGSKSSTYLSSLTHREAPWKDARGDLLPGQIGCEEITHAAMAEYYGGLVR